MDIKQYTEANRKAWNEVAPIHQKAKKERKKVFLEPGYSCLNQTLTEQLEKIGIEGKDVAQLCCNDGVELMSIRNLGAGHCVGFDISELNIEEARRVATEAKIECEFVRTDIYEIDEKYHNSFDLVVITAGTLTWFPDINLFFEKVNHLLREGGQVIIYEIHPYLFLLDEGNKENPLTLTYSYFIKEPRVFYNLDYVGKSEYEGAAQYNFDPTISQIITSLLKNQMEIKTFNEYDHDVSALFKHLETEELNLPMSYLLIAQKRG